MKSTRIEDHFLGYCPFCGVPLLFLEETIPSVHSCPVCEAPIAFREHIDLEKEEVGYEIVPNIKGESFFIDGYTVENGMLVRYEGESDKLVTPKGAVAIAPEAFKEHRHLSSVTVSEGVKYVGSNAFSGCEGIKSLTLPESLVAIGNSAFAGCRRLSEVKVPKGLRAGGFAIFHSCDNLTEVLMPMDMSYLGGSPHAFCKKLRVANVPNCVRSIGVEWFLENDKLEVLTVGKNAASLVCHSKCLRELHFLNPTGWKLLRICGEDEDVPEKALSNPKSAASYFKKLRNTLYRPDGSAESYWLRLDP